MTVKSLLMRCTKSPASGLVTSCHPCSLYNKFQTMVLLTRILYASAQTSKGVIKKKRSTRGWIDSLRVYVKGGSGGNGLPPVDGVGGHGGSVYIKASDSISSLHDVRRKNTSQRYIADPGEDSS